MGKPPGPLGTSPSHHHAPGPRSVATAPRDLAEERFAKAVAITQFNLGCCDKHDIDKTLSENAKHFGGQRKANGAIPRLANSPNMLRAIFQSADELDLNPLFVAAALFTELDPDYSGGPIDTYNGIGMDLFLQEYPSMVREGLLPKGFRKTFIRTSEVVENEAGARVRIARFRRIGNAIRAFAAILKHRRERMMQDLTEAGITEVALSGDELDYWTYVYFNSAYPKKHFIDERVEPLGPAGMAVPTETFQSAGNFGSALGNAQRMLAIKSLLKWAGMVDPSDLSTLHFNFHLESLDALTK